MGQHGGMSQETTREHIHAMQNEAPKSTTAGTFGRSSIKRLPSKLREAVDQAIADGATIDEITTRIRAEGEDCSRSAVGRYAKNVRDLIRQQQETDRTIKARVAVAPSGLLRSPVPADGGFFVDAGRVSRDAKPRDQFLTSSCPDLIRASTSPRKATAGFRNGRPNRGSVCG